MVASDGSAISLCLLLALQTSSGTRIPIGDRLDDALTAAGVFSLFAAPAALLSAFPPWLAGVLLLSHWHMRYQAIFILGAATLSVATGSAVTASVGITNVDGTIKPFADGWADEFRRVWSLLMISGGFGGAFYWPAAERER